MHSIQTIESSICPKNSAVSFFAASWIIYEGSQETTNLKPSFAKASRVFAYNSLLTVGISNSGSGVFTVGFQVHFQHVALP